MSFNRPLLLLTLLFCRQTGFAQLSPRQEKNLAAFTRLYGYVRYFHPSDEAARLNWNQFAIYGSLRVLDAGDDGELIRDLDTLFRPIAPTVCIYLTSQTPPIISVAPPDTTGYTVVAWQHQGWGLGTNPTYQSIRLGRPRLLKRQGGQHLGFAPIIQSFDAGPFRGKTVRLTGWMKVDGADGGRGHLWMRVDKRKGYGFFYNMDDKPASEDRWKAYIFTGKIDTDADNIVFGAFLAGPGRLWIDNIQLQVQDENGWADMPVKNAGFETWNAGQIAGWHSNPALTGYRMTADTTDAKEGHTSLLIASTEEDSLAPAPAPLFAQYPRPGDYIRESLGEGIACTVPLALYGNADHTYPAGNDKTLTKKIRQASSDNPTADSLGLRLGDVVISWTIFRHFFPYWADASATPDRILEDALNAAAKDRTPAAFKETLEHMTAPLNDGHVWVTMDGDSQTGYFPPLTITRVGNQIVVDHVLDSIPGLSPGDRILTLNGQPMETTFAASEGRLSGSPQWKTYRATINVLEGPRDSVINLITSRTTLSLKRSCSAMRFYAGLPIRHPSGWIRPGVFYLDIGRDKIDSIRAWLPQLSRARAIVCDLRGYPTDEPGFIRYLLKQPDTTHWMFLPQITRPNFQGVTYEPLGWGLPIDSPHLGAHIYFLTDGRAISYAESYMGFIKDFKLATIVGEPTAGTNGDVNPFSLPGGYKISWTGLLVKNHDGSRHHLIGIVPDVVAKRTVEGVRNGKDEVLDKALALTEKD